MTASTTTATGGSTGTPGPSRRPMSDGDYSYDPADYPDDRSFENRMAELDFRDAWDAMTETERMAMQADLLTDAYFDDIPWGKRPDDETIKRLRPNVVRVGRAA